MSSRAKTLSAAAAALLLAACRGERVSTYRVPREKDPELPMAAAADAGNAVQQAPGQPMADTAVPTAPGQALLWQAPAGWTAKAASAMRKGSFAVPGAAGVAELSITAFPGDVGGELANVNRWRGQIGLAALQPGELGGAESRMESNGLSFTVVELEAPGGAGAKAILGAMVPFGGSTWFFKLTGPAASVSAAKPDFMAFLHTVRAP